MGGVGRTADDWQDEWLKRCNQRHKRQRIMRDRMPRNADRKLAAERKYDAETEKLRIYLDGVRRRRRPTERKSA